MKRILITLTLALAFTAAAQTFEYAGLTYNHSDRGYDDAAVLQLATGIRSGKYLRDLAESIQPDQDHSGTFGIVRFLNVMGSDGWQVVHVETTGSEYTVLFQRAAP